MPVELFSISCQFDLDNEAEVSEPLVIVAFDPIDSNQFLILVDLVHRAPLRVIIRIVRVDLIARPVQKPQSADVVAIVIKGDYASDGPSGVELDHFGTGVGVDALALDWTRRGAVSQRAAHERERVFAHLHEFEPFERDVRRHLGEKFLRRPAKVDLLGPRIFAPHWQPAQSVLLLERGSIGLEGGFLHKQLL